MAIIRIEKATALEAKKLTEIQKRAFDKEVKKWLPNQNHVVDCNILPPGYSSIEITKYMMRELTPAESCFRRRLLLEKTKI